MLHLFQVVLCPLNHEKVEIPNPTTDSKTMSVFFEERGSVKMDILHGVYTLHYLHGPVLLPCNAAVIYTHNAV